MEYDLVLGVGLTVVAGLIVNVAEDVPVLGINAANPAVASITVTDDGGVNLQLGTTRAIWAQEVDSSVVPLDSPDGIKADEVLFEETVSWITRSSRYPARTASSSSATRSTASWRRSRSTGAASTPSPRPGGIRGVALVVAQLIITASIAIVPPVNATPKVRASIQSLLREIAPGLQQVLNRAVGRIRQSGPRQTGRMASRARVRRLRPQLPGGVSAELRLPAVLFERSRTRSTPRVDGSTSWRKTWSGLWSCWAISMSPASLRSTPIKSFQKLVRVAARSRGTVRVRRTPGDVTSF